jgi:hypothetical protein
MKKISKDPSAKNVMPNMPNSEHFTTGSFVVMNNHRGEILAVETEGWPVVKKYLRVAWEDGSVSRIEPIALNR